MRKIAQKRAFWMSFFHVLLFFFAGLLFLIAEYNTTRSGYTPQPPLYRLAREIMEPVSQMAEPLLRWMGLA